jgi:hypothetical protein
MAQIAMSTYADTLCVDPGGYPIVYTFDNDTTDTYGWILRDDADEQLMLVFRGSETALDFAEDSNYNQSAFEGEGINCDGCMVHQGYWQCWTSVRDEVIAQMQNQSSLNSGYSWIIIGHRLVSRLQYIPFQSNYPFTTPAVAHYYMKCSLGGGVSSLAAAQTFDMFPDSNMTVYTQGQPRTGNQAYVNYVEDRFGTGSSGRFLRSTHEDDMIPHLPPMSDGYVHHATEYWNLDPSEANNTWICMGADGTECNEVQPGSDIVRI